jgi:hypothetical protein
MPAMCRPKGKITKIAWSVMGKPINMIDDKRKKDNYIDKRLRFEETSFER